MSYWYLATPYTKFPGGIESAFVMACEATAQFIRARVPVHSPIAHTHPVAKYGNIDPLDHSIWLPADKPMMDAAYGLIVWKAISWDQSYGIQKEIEEFQRQNKPIVHLDPDDFPIDHFREFAREHGWEF